jgi:hypothetical protein
MNFSSRALSLAATLVLLSTAWCAPAAAADETACWRPNIDPRDAPKTVAQLEAESLERLVKEAGRVPQVPFGFSNKDWNEFKAKHKIGDGEKLVWYVGGGLGGYLLMREGCVVASFNTVVID